MTTSNYIGKKSNKEWRKIISDFNACYDAKDRRNAICNWLKKYTSISNYSEVTGFCGPIGLTDLPQVYYGETKINFWAD